MRRRATSGAVAVVCCLLAGACSSSSTQDVADATADDTAVTLDDPGTASETASPGERSASGSSLVVASTTSDGQLEIIDLSNGDVFQVGNGDELVWGAGSAAFASMSPDGTQLVASTVGVGGIGGRLQLFDLATGGVVVLVDSADHQQLFPEFSPSGRYIAYNDFNMSLTGDAEGMTVFDLESGTVVATFGPDALSGSWSPTTDALAVRYFDGLAVASGSDGWTPRRLVDVGEISLNNGYRIAWAPEGDAITYRDNEAVDPDTGSITTSISVDTVFSLAGASTLVERGELGGVVFLVDAATGASTLICREVTSALVEVDDNSFFVGRELVDIATGSVTNFREPASRYYFGVVGLDPGDLGLARVGSVEVATETDSGRCSLTGETEKVSVAEAQEHISEYVDAYLSGGFHQSFITNDAASIVDATFYSLDFEYFYRPSTEEYECERREEETVCVLNNGVFDSDFVLSYVGSGSVLRITEVRPESAPASVTGDGADLAVGIVEEYLEATESGDLQRLQSLRTADFFGIEPMPPIAPNEAVNCSIEGGRSYYCTYISDGAIVEVFVDAGSLQVSGASMVFFGD